ncbi:MAG: LysR family transcriptional regulator [Sneathiellaceae bacterium]
MDRLGAMRAFVKVCDTGSFTAAARALGVPKSAVSKQVAWLEENLGVRLLNRTTRRSNITEVGQGYLERCRRILEDVAEAEAQAAELQTRPGGRLRVTTPFSFGLLYLSAVLCDIATAYPELELDVTMTDRFVSLLDEGFDLAIRIGDLPDSNLIGRRIADTRLVLCASPGYFARAGLPRVPADLAGHNCLIYAREGQQDHWQFRDNGRDISVQPRGNLRVNNGDALKMAAMHGLGIAQLPVFLITAELAARQLQPVLTTFERPPLAIHAVYPHNRHLSAKVRVFVDELVKRFGHGADRSGHQGA